MMTHPNLDEITAESLLESASLMDWFTAKMSHMRMMNRSGSAFRSHPQMYWKDGILITNHWKTYGSTDIKIASDKTAQCVAGSQESCGYGNPYPSLSTGEFFCVWQCGKWLKNGPWDEPISRLLNQLLDTMRSMIHVESEKQRIAAIEYEETKRLKEETLLAEWTR